MYEVRGKKLPEKYYKPSSLAYSCLPTLQHGCEVGDRCKKSQRFCTQFPANKMPPALVVMTILKKSANIKPVPTLKEEKGTSSFQYTHDKPDLQSVFSPTTQNCAIPTGSTAKNKKSLTSKHTVYKLQGRAISHVFIL